MVLPVSRCPPGYSVLLVWAVSRPFTRPTKMPHRPPVTGWMWGDRAGHFPTTIRSGWPKPLQRQLCFVPLSGSRTVSMQRSTC